MRWAQMLAYFAACAALLIPASVAYAKLLIIVAVRFSGPARDLLNLCVFLVFVPVVVAPLFIHISLSKEFWQPGEVGGDWMFTLLSAGCYLLSVFSGMKYVERRHGNELRRHGIILFLMKK